MVLKGMIIFLLLSFKVVFAVENETKSDQSMEKHISSLRILLDKGEYEEVEEFYDKMEDLIGENTEAMDFLALSYEKRLKYSSALKIYSDLIKRKFPAEIELINKLKDKQFLPLKMQNEKLKYYLYKQALLNILIYQSSTIFTSSTELKERKNALRSSVSQAWKSQVEKNDLRNLVEKLDDKIKENNSYKYKRNFFLTSQIVSWQQHLELKNLSTNEKFQILATNFGQCFGGGISWINAYHEFDFETCFGRASSTVSPQSQSITYQQSNVNISFIQMEPGFYTKYFSEFVLIGVHIPLFYSKGGWQEPNNNYQFKEKSSLRLGYHLAAKVKIKKFDLITKIGKVFPNPSSHWIIGLNYNF